MNPKLETQIVAHRNEQRFGWGLSYVPETLRVYDFFIFRCSLRLESSQEHLPTSIAGVPRPRSGQALRLRAIKPTVCDRSAKRFAQDDGFVGGLKYSWLDMRKT
jgi:hypothetical protein